MHTQAAVETASSSSSRNSVLHNSTVVSHAFMNAGTTVDTFLRDNLEWMGRAANWAKFTATASIGQCLSVRACCALPDVSFGCVSM